MPDWYVSSAAYAAIPQFTASGVYSVGNIIRPLTAPVFNQTHVFRCTTAGTASTEPTWTSASANNSTVASGGATFTNVTGQSTYGWGAAAGNYYSLASQAPSPRLANGDRVFLSSDHSENSAANANYAATTTAAFNIIQIISVNRAGSVPPVAADVLVGAALTYSGSGQWLLDPYCNMLWQGITFTLGGTALYMSLGSAGTKAQYFRNCAFVLTTSTATAYIGAQLPCRATFDNTTVQFGNVGHRINFGNLPFDFTWINTASAVLGTAPTNLFSGGSGGPGLGTCRGVDLSAATGTLYYGTNVSPYNKILLDSCRIASGAVRLGTTNYNAAADEIELVNCYDGTSFLSERHTPAGDVTTEFTITLSGGAADNVGTFSHKMVSSVRSDKYALMLDGFWMDANYTTTGVSKTASVEIISSGSLNNDDIVLVLEYLGTASSTRASFVTTHPTPLDAIAAIATSTATWNSSPATPVKQLLSVTFTPQTAGRVRAQVRLGKASTTVYYNPQVTIT